MDIAAELLNIDAEVLIEGVCDSDHYIELLESFFEPDGAPLIVVGYQPLPAPGFESGRYNHRQRHEQVVNGFVTDGDVPIKDRCVVFYRQNSRKGLEMATIPDVSGLNEFGVCFDFTGSIFLFLGSDNCLIEN